MAEELGFADVWVSDHIVHPAAQSYPSPYLFDALTCLTWAGASTERIGLGTSVLVVPMHDPLSLANTLASLDRLSGGRVVIGAGVGWSEAEYSAVGQSFADRGRRMDEALDLMRAVWSEDPVTFHGEYSDFENIRVLPKPAHQIEIWMGGQSPAALRRAVKRGDGYQALGRSPDEAAELVVRIRQDRPEPTFTISVRTGWDPQGMDRDRIRAERDQFEEVGVQHMVAAPWQSDRTSWLRSMELLADLVLRS